MPFRSPPPSRPRWSAPPPPCRSSRRRSRMPPTWLRPGWSGRIRPPSRPSATAPAGIRRGVTFPRPSEIVSASVPGGPAGRTPVVEIRMLQQPATTATILIIDDQESNLRLLERVLISAGYQAFVSTTDPLKAVDLYRQYRPDLVVLDLHMPMLDGIGVLERLNEHMPEGAYVPVLVITGDLSPTTKQRALSAGAKDFLGKPFDPLE